MNADVIVPLLASAGLAVWAIILQRKQTELQKRLIGIEEFRHETAVAGDKRADVIAWVTTRDKHGRPQPCLYHQNRGRAVAREVSFDPEIFAPATVVGHDRLPIAQMRPGQPPSYFDLAVPRAAPRDVLLVLNWADDSGPRREEMTVHVA